MKSIARKLRIISDLYYVEGKAFMYVESFLKMFYLIFGQAYSRNYLDVDSFAKWYKIWDVQDWVILRRFLPLCNP